MAGEGRTHACRPVDYRPDVLLTEELPKTLRSLSSSVDPLADRLHSLQTRNIVEVRVPNK